MRSKLKQILWKLNEDFRDENASIFTNPRKFKSALDDICIDTDAKRIRHVLNVAVRDMQVYTRLKTELAKSTFIIDNLANEMSSDYMIDKNVAKTVIESFAELLGYAVKPTPSNELPIDNKSLKVADDDGKDDFDKGIAYYMGRNLFEAQQCLKKAADKGNIYAQCALGDLYADSANPNADPYQAMQWYSKAAEKGNVKAQWLLGAGYLSGIGIEKDEDKAKYWLQQSADQGYPDGQCGLGGYYFLQSDYTNAKYWLNKAADQGHSEAKEMVDVVSMLNPT